MLCLTQLLLFLCSVHKMSLFHIKLGLQINVGLLVSQNFFLSPPMDAVGGDLYNWGPTYLYIGLIRFWFDIIQFGLTSHVRSLHPSYPALCGRVSPWVVHRHTCTCADAFFIIIIETKKTVCNDFQSLKGVSIILISSCPGRQ